MQRILSDASLFGVSRDSALGVALCGWLMTLAGSVVSLFGLMNLFPFGPNPGDPSPLGHLLANPVSIWCAYAVGTALFVAGMVMIAGVPLHPACGLIYLVVPILAVTFSVFTALRTSRNAIVSDIYWIAGAALALTGGLGLWQAVQGVATISPILASLMLQIGLVSVVAATFALNRHRVLQHLV